MGRKKKLKKGIESLEKQLSIHDEKFNLTTDERLKKYWKKEMGTMEKNIEKKKKQLDRIKSN